MRVGRARTEAGSRRMPTWARLAGAVAAIAAPLAMTTGPLASADDGPSDATTAAGPSARATDGLAVIDQTFTIPVDGAFEITVAVPPDVDIADFDERSVLVVAGHRAIADRGEFQNSTRGDLKGTEDTFDVSLDPAVADPNLIAVTPTSLSVRIPTETVTRTPEALQMSQSGVHAVVLELRVNDRPVGEVTTYVNRLPSVSTATGPLAVSIVARQLTLPVIDDDGSVAVSDIARDELGQLSDVLAALDAAALAAGTTVPRGIQVEPSVLRAVVDTEPELAATLLPGLAASDLIASPRLPFDPSAAVAADQVERYGDWLREGEDIVGGILPSTVVDRSVVLVDDRLSSDAAAMQRNFGTQLMMLPYDFYTDLDGSLLDFTDISQLISVELADGQTVQAAVIDDFLGSQMVRGADEPVSTAIEVAAELVVLARDIDIDGGAVDRHGVVLALPDMSIPDAAFMAELAPLLLGSPSLRLVTPRELETSTTTLLNDGRQVTLTLPDSAGPDIGPRIERLDAIAADVLSYASMLPDAAPDIERWSATLDAFPSTALTDAEADAAAARLEADFAAYRDAIVAPEPFAFTLTGRESKLPLSLANTSDQTLRVRVSLSSPKMNFPGGDQIVSIAAQSEQDLTFDVEALSNGKSSVFLRIYAPAENRDVELVPEVVLTARVNSFAGLGQLITGAGLLLVLSWWAHHARSNRRTALAARRQSRHPSSHRAAPIDTDATCTTSATSATSSSDTESTGPTSRPAPRAEVSPDAAASSLPPS